MTSISTVRTWASCFPTGRSIPGRPDADEGKGGGFAIAIGFRYSHGRGQGLGVLLPAQYDPSSITATGANGKINEIALNLGANVSF